MAKRTMDSGAQTEIDWKARESGAAAAKGEEIAGISD
jgi:hypothetical protein